MKLDEMTPDEVRREKVLRSLSRLEKSVLYVEKTFSRNDLFAKVGPGIREGSLAELTNLKARLTIISDRLVAGRSKIGEWKEIE